MKPRKLTAFILSALLMAALAVPASAHGPHHGQNGRHHAQACVNQPDCNYALPDWAEDEATPGTNGIIAKKTWASEDANGDVYTLPEWASSTRVCLHGDTPPCSTAGQSGMCGGHDSSSRLTTSIFSPIFNHICCIH